MKERFKMFQLIYPRNPTPTTPAPAIRKAPRTFTTPPTFKESPLLVDLFVPKLLLFKLLPVPGPVATFDELEGLGPCGLVELGELVELRTRVVVVPAMSTCVICH